MNPTFAQGLQNNPYHRKLIQKWWPNENSSLTKCTFSRIAWVKSVSWWKVNSPYKNQLLRSHHFCSCYYITSNILSLWYPLYIHCFIKFFRSNSWIFPSSYQHHTSLPENMNYQCGQGLLFILNSNKKNIIMK